MYRYLEPKSRKIDTDLQELCVMIYRTNEPHIIKQMEDVAFIHGGEFLLCQQRAKTIAENMKKESVKRRSK